MGASIVLVPLLGLLFLCARTVSSKQEYLFRDPKLMLEARVTNLLGLMTLEEKIGQMTQLERVNLTKEIMRDYTIGSVLSGGGSVPKTNASAKDWIKMVNEFQKWALSNRLKIPMLYAIDAVHGNNNVYKATIFPHNIGLGATRDPKLVEEIGAATALETRATGIPYAFSPCVAVCRDPRWGRCYESFSEDPTIVQQMTSIVTGLQGPVPPNSLPGFPYISGKDKVLACAKHYVGDGGTKNGINENNTVADPKTLLEIHMPGYVEAIKRGVGTIMASYSSLNGVKMHANHEYIAKYLKSALWFKGFVISDYQALEKITSPPGANYTYSVQAAILAGVDMVMVPYDYKSFIGNLTMLVKKNVVPMSRIDDAVTRILRVKFAMGLFENPMADESFIKHLGSKAHRELARKAVRKSLVLLKNGGTPVLPLPKKTGKILVAGSHAHNLGRQCGGWTISWQGESGNNYTVGTTILDGIRATVDKSTEVIYKENVTEKFTKSSKFDHAIVVIGELPYAETRGDNANLTIPKPGLDTMNNVCDNIKCIVVLISGRPLVIEPYLHKIKAFVAAWLPGSEGQGVADVLFGDYGFTGKLPRTWFKRVDQLPMNFHDAHYDPLLPLGFGIITKPRKGKGEAKPRKGKGHGTDEF